MTEHQNPGIIREAKRVVALADCASRGHDFRVMTALGSLDPRRIICDRCGRSWGVLKGPVHVVVADVGLNGPEVMGVYQHRPDDAMLDRLAKTARPGEANPPASWTGFSGLGVTEHEVKP